jgi:hypothetical protein
LALITITIGHFDVILCAHRATLISLLLNQPVKLTLIDVRDYIILKYHTDFDELTLADNDSLSTLDLFI